MRVVLDTNIFVSAVFFGGLPQKIVALAEQRKITPCFAIETFDELQTVLNDEKFSQLRNSLNFSVVDFLEKLKNYSLLFALPANPPTIIKENRADNYFLACSLASQSQYIVSGDQHLLKLKQFQGIPILTPAQFLNQLKKN